MKSRRATMAGLKGMVAEKESGEDDAERASNGDEECGEFALAGQR